MTGDNPATRRLEIRVDPDYIHDRSWIRSRIEKQTTAPFADFRIVRRAIDSRQKRPVFVLQVALLSRPAGEIPAWAPVTGRLEPVLSGRRAVVVGAGPAGYVAALGLIEQGIRPVILERGRDVRTRRKSLARIQRDGVVEPDSNYCFGEGGAGAYSDGKLYTRSAKRGDVGRILRILVEHGAREEILIDAEPHIGSNRLPGIIRSMRETILALGGEIRFGARVTDLLIEDGAAAGARLADGERVPADAVILACGHSAREIFMMLHRRGIRLEAKPFAMGVRVEHPQALIDRVRYHHWPRHPNLPPAAYRLRNRVEDRGVYTFCMCPGGFIVPTATAPGELVLNGMSLAGRDAPYANAGLVVEVHLADARPRHGEGPLAAMAFQREVERRAFEASGDGTQRAPAQRMTDFAAGRASSTLPGTSYLPGIFSHRVDELLPEPVSRRLRAALPDLDRKMKGFFTGEAIVVAVESRTSSPVRIPRDPARLTHPQVPGLFPCGEGAGYAGGIISAAVDGARVAEQAGALLQGGKKG